MAEDLLVAWEVVQRPASAVDNGLLPPELGPRDLDRTNSLDVPPDAKVYLADLPVFEEDGAPDGRKDRVREGVFG